ncbi:MAG: alpha/beta fold hydrolase, partial [Planctomycetota bacterium]
GRASPRTGCSIHETFDLAASAMDALLDRSGVPITRTIMLGHSLGAARAAVVTNGNAAGYVLLAGAYLSPTADRPTQLAATATAEGNDFDGSGAITGWERAAAQRLADGITRDRAKFLPDHDIPWASDVLLDSNAPILAIWGGLDPVSIHGPLLEQLRQKTDTVYVPDVGHQLGPESAGLAGPIAPKVVDRIVEWLSVRFTAD